MTETQRQQEQLEDLKPRMDILEKAEIRLRIQSVGPRGCQGVPGQNAEGIKGDKGDSVRGNTGDAGRDGRDGSDAEVDYAEIELRILAILTDYGIVSELGPTRKFVEDKNFLANGDTSAIR
jgi:hypothetical protein